MIRPTPTVATDEVERVARAISEAGGASNWEHALEVARAAIDSMPVMEALTPSAETKAAYMGEFSFQISDGYDEGGGDLERIVEVPWTTIKEIMAAIKARALLGEQGK